MMTTFKVGLSFIFLFAVGQSFGQKFWSTGNGKIDLYSYTPIEDIKASSIAAGGIINTETGQLAFKVPIKTFIFPNSLMQEHFNENFMESEKYPNGTFDGKLDQTVDFSKPGTYPVSAKGKFNLHGIETEREFKGTLTIKPDQTADLVSEIEVVLVDHKIERPKLVLVNIAEKVSVKVAFTFKAKK